MLFLLKKSLEPTPSCRTGQPMVTSFIFFFFCELIWFLLSFEESRSYAYYLKVTLRSQKAPFTCVFHQPKKKRWKEKLKKLTPRSDFSSKPNCIRQTSSHKISYKFKTTYSFLFLTNCIRKLKSKQIIPLSFQPTV